MTLVPPVDAVLFVPVQVVITALRVAPVCSAPSLNSLGRSVRSSFGNVNNCRTGNVTESPRVERKQ
jgi:hypothetical protein